MQNKSVNLLLPIDYFVNSTENRLVSSASNVIILNEFSSRHWINAHNVMHFLKNDGKYLRYITADDCDTGYLHLYYYKISLDRNDLIEYVHAQQPNVLTSKQINRTQLTEGSWCVDCDENVNVDEENGLVYFSAFRDPLECHL